MEIANWLQRLLPKVQSRGEQDACWVAHMKARTPEHHPPLYWLGRALDVVDKTGSIDVVSRALFTVHGPVVCGGWSEQDQRAQDVLTSACALAWVSQHLGNPELVEVDAGERLLVLVPSLDVLVVPRRLWAPPGPAQMPPIHTPDALLRQIGEYAAAAENKPMPEGKRIFYVDLNLHRGPYARDVGYHRELTEPVRASVKHHSTTQRMGWVLTRPFEWGVPIESWY